MVLIIDVALARLDAFLSRIQGVLPVSGRVQFYRQQSLQNAPQEHAIPLFGAESGAFGEDWADYRVAQVKGPATQSQPLQNEMRQYDGDIEKWRGPNPEIPSMVAHGKRLDYGRNTDQQPIHSLSGSIDEKWDGQIRNVAKRPDFQALRGKSEPTIGDQHAIDLRKKYEFDFSV